MSLPSQTAVVLLPSSHAAELLELAQQWTAAWLLAPAAYVNVSDFRVTDGSVSVPCQVVGHDTSVNLELFEALSRYEADVLRIIAVRIVSGSGKAATDDGQHLVAIRNAVERARSQSRRIVTVNLLIAPTGRGGITDDPNLVLPDWVNVVASPEDRESLEGYDRFTREADVHRFIGITLSHAAAAGGLWAGSPSSPYDDNTDTVRGVIMQRASLRGVFADGMLADVAIATAGRLIESRLLFDELVVARIEGLKPLAPQAVDEATQQLIEDSLALDDGALTYAQVEPLPPTEKRSLRWGSQLAEFTRFATDVLTSVPVSIAQGLARRASRRLTDALHGADGEAELVVPRWMPQLSREIGDEAKSLKARQAAGRAALDRPLPRAREDVNPRLWASLRQLSFATLDGSELPSGVAPLGETAPAVEVFGDANLLIPDWRDQWSPSRSGVAEAEARFDLFEPSAHWNDEQALARWKKRLSSAAAAQARLADAKEARAGDLRLKVEELETELVLAEDQATLLTDEAETLRSEFEDARSATGASADEIHSSQPADEEATGLAEGDDSVPDQAESSPRRAAQPDGPIV